MGTKPDNIQGGKMANILRGHTDFRAAAQRAIDSSLLLFKHHLSTIFSFAMLERKPRVSLLSLQTAILGSQRPGSLPRAGQQSCLVLLNLATASGNQ